MWLFSDLASHVQQQQLPSLPPCPDVSTPGFSRAYSVLSLSYALCGVEHCCHTTLSLSFLAQAFSGLEATFKLIKGLLAPSLQEKRIMGTVQ